MALYANQSAQSNLSGRGPFGDWLQNNFGFSQVGAPATASETISQAAMEPALPANQPSRYTTNYWNGNERVAGPEFASRQDAESWGQEHFGRHQGTFAIHAGDSRATENMRNADEMLRRWENMSQGQLTKDLSRQANAQALYSDIKTRTGEDVSDINTRISTLETKHSDLMAQLDSALAGVDSAAARSKLAEEFQTNIRYLEGRLANAREQESNEYNLAVASTRDEANSALLDIRATTTDSLNLQRGYMKESIKRFTTMLDSRIAEVYTLGTANITELKANLAAQLEQVQTGISSVMVSASQSALANGRNAVARIQSNPNLTAGQKAQMGDQARFQAGTAAMAGVGSAIESYNKMRTDINVAHTAALANTLNTTTTATAEIMSAGATQLGQIAQTGLSTFGNILSARTAAIAQTRTALITELGDLGATHIGNVRGMSDQMMYSYAVLATAHETNMVNTENAALDFTAAILGTKGTTSANHELHMATLVQARQAAQESGNKFLLDLIPDMDQPYLMDDVPLLNYMTLMQAFADEDFANALDMAGIQEQMSANNAGTVQSFLGTIFEALLGG